MPLRYTRPLTFEQRHAHDALGNAPDQLTPAHAARLAHHAWRRAGGDCVCTCGKLYYDHPAVVGALWLHELCDGDLVKL